MMDECEHDTGASPQAPAPRALGDGVVHAGLPVLSNRTLWDLITGFMAGYPFVVLRFHKEHKATVLRRDKRVGYLGDDGVLLHLAIAVDDLAMLKFS